jgi:hypothetical protein
MSLEIRLALNLHLRGVSAGSGSYYSSLSEPSGLTGGLFSGKFLKFL